MQFLFLITGLILSFFLGRFVRWLHFRIQEWQIMRDKDYDGSSFIQVCKDYFK